MNRSQQRNKYDVVVIGAGMGGLTAAAVLAKAGLSVFVADINRTPGGCIAGFSRNGFHFETAIHWLNLFGPEGGARRLLSYIHPNVPDTPAPQNVRRYKGESFDYSLSSNPDELRDTLVRDYPRDERGIVRFFSTARDIGAAFDRMTGRLQNPRTMNLTERVRLFARSTSAGLPFMKYSRWRAEDGLKKFFPSTRAGQIFCSEAKFVACLVPIGWIYTDNYHLPPKGGARRLARWLSESVDNLGGHVVYQTRATRAIVENGTARGVMFSDLPTGEEYRVDCNYVVAACDTETLYSELLPENTVGRRWLARLRNADIYDSAVTISLGLNRPASDYGIGEELIYLTRDNIPRHLHDSGDPNIARITLMSSSSIDPDLAPAGKGTLSIYLPAKLSLFDNWKSGANFERGAAYREHKKRYADVILKRIEASLIPGLRDDVEICDVATPLTYLRYTGNRQGTIMGTRMSFRNVMSGLSGYTSPIPNLYIGSQWAEYSGGVPLAIRAGANSALLILRRESKSAFEAAKEMF